MIKIQFKLSVLVLFFVIIGFIVVYTPNDKEENDDLALKKVNNKKSKEAEPPVFKTEEKTTPQTASSQDFEQKRDLLYTRISLEIFEKPEILGYEIQLDKNNLIKSSYNVIMQLDGKDLVKK